ncbi:hypothetical protein N7539_006571 [Penicillium diatomitis]|uniref:Uncharacterized protein n=1 Tax=Penicillium diatomitis TaxID=2819901 RepID=A0A9W9X1Z2_9EURO|nr:uncharacterized protein N7539_006571 [Penicillium diatomitis]KAJ5480677.1 hypothetical protein N7539_006571 [Penicillium diatomitis]
MSLRAASVIYESDTASDERSTIHTANVKIRAKFQIARLPPKSSHHSSSLRLSPKLVLQIQQLLPNHRPIPVLEIWQPSLRRSKLTRDFVQRPKLRSGDLYATLDEPYVASAAHGSPSRPGSRDHTEDAHNESARNEAVAALCQNQNQPQNQNQQTNTTTTTNGGNPAKSGLIYFRDTQCGWQASVGTTGPEKKICYRFTINDETREPSTGPGQIFLQWEKRPLTGKSAVSGNRPATATGSASASASDSEHFNSILDCVQSCRDLLRPVSGTGTEQHGVHASLENWLCTQVLTLGVWVAQQEGWLGL